MDYIILEPWALAAQSLADPMQRLAFWDAIAAFALDGREPDPADGIGVMAVAMCRRMLETHRNKVEGGRAGGRKRVENSKQTASISQADGKHTASISQADGKHTASISQADGKQTASISQADGKQTASISQADATIKKDKKDKNESSSARGRAVPALKQVLDEAETRNWLSVLPGWTMDDLRAALSLAYAELDRAGWLDRNGNAVKNWRTYLQKVVSEKKIYARAALPFDSVPIGSTEEE